MSQARPDRPSRGGGPTGRAQTPDRDARLKAALKANIARRKAQAKARADDPAQDRTADRADDQDGTAEQD